MKLASEAGMLGAKGHGREARADVRKALTSLAAIGNHWYALPGLGKPVTRLQLDFSGTLNSALAFINVDMRTLLGPQHDKTWMKDLGRLTVDVCHYRSFVNATLDDLRQDGSAEPTPTPATSSTAALEPTPPPAPTPATTSTGSGDPIAESGIDSLNEATAKLAAALRAGFATPASYARFRSDVKAAAYDWTMGMQMLQEDSSQAASAATAYQQAVRRATVAFRGFERALDAGDPVSMRTRLRTAAKDLAVAERDGHKWAAQWASGG